MASVVIDFVAAKSMYSPKPRPGEK
jgi:hypothetical protein